MTIELPKMQTFVWLTDNQLSLFGHLFKVVGETDNNFVCELVDSVSFPEESQTIYGLPVITHEFIPSEEVEELKQVLMTGFRMSGFRL